MRWFRNLIKVQMEDSEVAKIIENEIERQEKTIELIASENFASPSVMEAQSSVMTNKYAEGYPGKRYYGGCKYYDEVENLAIDRVKDLFGAEHANVQPHSGSQANFGVYFSVLKTGDKILAMDLSHGGHLTHGSPVNFSGTNYNVHFYGVDPKTEMIDYDEVLRIAKEVKPKLIICGASAYPRIIDFEEFRYIADKVNAYLMADIAHIAGLVVAGVHPSPFPYADFVTTTTQKTLRGPRGGVILCKKEYAEKVDKAIFPGLQGGPLMNTIAAKAVAFKEAMKPEFKEYQKQIVKNAKALAQELIDQKFRLVSGGTDNHLMLVDLQDKGMTGKEAQKEFEEIGITLNKNSIPFDPQPLWVTSGVRLGTPAVTTRGMKEEEMKEIGKIFAAYIKNKKDEKIVEHLKERVAELCKKFPLYY